MIAPCLLLRAGSRRRARLCAFKLCVVASSRRRPSFRVLLESQALVIQIPQKMLDTIANQLDSWKKVVQNQSIIP